MKEPNGLSPRFIFLSALALSLMLGVVDWASGYELQFFIFYFIPISLVAWNCGLARTLVVSALCGALWFSIDMISGHPYNNMFYAAWCALIRISSFLVNGYSVVRVKQLLLAERRSAMELRRSREEVKTLKGLLPACARCRRVRDDADYWQQLRDYLDHHADANATHGCCRECAAKGDREREPGG